MLRLYDPDRLRVPRLDGREALGWDEAEAPPRSRPWPAAKARGPVLLLTGALESPTRKALVADLGGPCPGSGHLALEPAAGGRPGGRPASLRRRPWRSGPGWRRPR